MILVHHVGAKSGTERVLPLVYFPQDDGTTVIVASKGGAPDNPDWYHNIKANPDITVEIGTETFPVHATEPTGEDRDKIYAACAAAAPQFAEYQEKTSRTIPVLVLTRSS